MRWLRWSRDGRTEHASIASSSDCPSSDRRWIAEDAAVGRAALAPPPSPILATPLLVDLTHRGGLDVLVAGFSGSIVALDGRTGRPRPGTPADVGSGAPVGDWNRRVLASPILVDVDSCGRREAVIATVEGALVILDPATGEVGGRGRYEMRLAPLETAGIDGLVSTNAGARGRGRPRGRRLAEAEVEEGGEEEEGKEKEEEEKEEEEEEEGEVEEEEKGGEAEKEEEGEEGRDGGGSGMTWEGWEGAPDDAAGDAAEWVAARSIDGFDDTDGEVDANVAVPVVPAASPLPLPVAPRPPPPPPPTPEWLPPRVLATPALGDLDGRGGPPLLVVPVTWTADPAFAGGAGSYGGNSAPPPPPPPPSWRPAWWRWISGPGAPLGRPCWRLRPTPTALCGRGTPRHPFSLTSMATGSWRRLQRRPRVEFIVWIATVGRAQGVGGLSGWARGPRRPWRDRCWARTGAQQWWWQTASATW